MTMLLITYVYIDPDIRRGHNRLVVREDGDTVLYVHPDDYRQTCQDVRAKYRKWCERRLAKPEKPQ